MRISLVAACLLTVAPWSEVAAQVDRLDRSPVAPQLLTTLVPGDTVEATPFGRYPAGRLHRWGLGEGYRELWALPARAPVLDLERFAGGLTLTGVGGGLQTRSLVFLGEDGQEWRFRSIDKDAARTLDPVLRETLAAKVLQDQIAHLFPLAATVVDRLLDAAGVLHPTPTLVVLPDDPRLGEHRETFRGMLGWMEVRPDEGPDGAPGFAGSGRVIASDRLIERLEEDSGNAVDARAYLRARLLDALVGDWDRHPDQWRWAGRTRGDTPGLIFEPIPRDRDWALSRLDGLVARFTWIPWPHYVGFRADFPSAFRLTWSGRALDRRLLSELDRSQWRAEATDLQVRITDRVIDEAVARLPSTYPDAVADELAHALRSRRDGLAAFADEYYALLAGWVDVHTTDEDEVARVRWLDDGRLELVVDDGSSGRGIRFRRVFDPDETREVRLYLHGGEDRFVDEGGPDGPIELRVIGGGGDDSLQVAGTGGTVHLYDDRGDNEFVPGTRATVDKRSWVDPVDPAENTHRAGHRDWGSRALLLPSVRYEPDLGLFVGSRVERVGYGFRHYPYRTRFAVTVAAASGTGEPDLALEADLPLGSSGVRAHLGTRIFGTEFHRFYGAGNDAPADDPAGLDAYAAPRRILSLDGAVVLAPLHANWALAVDASLRGHHPFQQAGTLIERQSPYGSGEFEEVVFGVRARVDTRARGSAPTNGVLFELAAEAAPPALDVLTTYGVGTVRAEAHWSALPDAWLRPALMVRAGGRHVWGRAPYHAAAFLGGAATLRGLRDERLTGDASLFFGLEARATLGQVVLVVPGSWGVLGLHDVGRVFVDGRSPGGWHRTWGGGLWIDFMNAFPVTVSAARGSEDTLVYITLGLPF